jgi:hypothetical protein
MLELNNMATMGKFLIMKPYPLPIVIPIGTQNSPHDPDLKYSYPALNMTFN